MPNGRVLVAGGSDATGPLNSAEVYNPETGAFTPTAKMGVAREGATAIALAGDSSGKILVAGGDDPLGRVGTSEIYDLSSDTFGSIETMPVARSFAPACLLPDGRVLLVGGRSTGESVTRTASLRDPVTGAWSDTNLADPRVDGAVALLPNGRVLVVGGYAASGGDSSVEVFDPSTARSTTMDGYVGSGRGGVTATTLKDGTVLIVGGYGSTNATTPGALIYAVGP